MNANEPTSESTDAASEQNTAACKSKPSGCCSPHMSLLVAVIAIVIAVYALVAGRSHTADMQVQDRLTNIEEQVASINTHLDQLGEDVKSNREHLIHTKLQKALENVQEIGQMATTETRSRLQEIETMLHDIISPEVKETAPAPTAETPAEAPVTPAEQPATTESAPAATAPGAADEPASSTEPQTPADSTAPAADAPAATTPDTSGDKPASTPQAF
ncbi:hypothetical protein [Mariprofundus ferrooxydans]|uniref:hypothetical protein n=1 Tax=Mariprofundus ferrooxydans TaxID=314344 RepID=UPI0003717EFF|nr:hypothetical protein [Mariprofundus ferrooxydans]